MPMHDLKIVLGKEFINQVHALLLLAMNSLSIFHRSKAYMVSTEHMKFKERTLSAVQFKKAFKKDPSS